MKIKAAMLSLEYNGKELSFIREIEEYSNPDICLGIENYSKTFITVTHYWDESYMTTENSIYNVIGFKLVADNEEELSNYCLKYTSKRENSFDDYNDFDCVNGWYFEAPKFKKNKDGYVVLNSEKRAAVGSIVAGAFFVRIFDASDNWVEKNGIYTVKVLPNGMSYDNFKVMIDDLFMIREELIQGESRQSIQFLYQKSLEDIDNMLDVITPVLRRISEQPFAAIRQELTSVAARKVKKFNNRVFSRVLSGNENGKVPVLVNRESSEIYEHKVLYDVLLQLKEYIEKYKDYVERDLLQKYNRIDFEKARIKEIFNGIDIEEFDGKSPSEIIKYIINRCEDINTLERSDTEYLANVVVSFYVPEFTDYEFKDIIRRLDRRYTKNGFLLRNKVKYKDVERNVITKYGDYYIANGGVCKYTYEDVYLFEVELISFNYDELVALEYIFRHPGVYTISGIIDYSKSKYCDRSDPAKDIGKYYRYDRNAYKFRFKKINTIDCLSPKEFLLNKIGLVDSKDIFYEICKDNIGKYSSLFDSINILGNYTRNKKTGEAGNISGRDLAKIVISKIDALLNLGLFNGIKKYGTSKGLNLISTQLFLNDRNYSFVFRQLKNIASSHSYTDKYDAKSIIIAKVDKLYEHWVIIAMLREFLRLGWKFNNCDNDITLSRKKLAEIIYMVIFQKHGGSFPKDTSMYLDVIIKGLSTRLWFNLEYEKNVYFLKNGRTAYKTPDYTMTFGLEEPEGDKKFIVYLDAKYRNYKQQGGIEGLKDDVTRVAYEKYYNSFIGTPDEPVASFIVHTHGGKKYTDWNMLVKDNRIIKTDEISNQRYLYSSIWNANMPHRFGAFSLLPTEYSNITTFTKMVLEYFYLEHFKLELFKQICVECGSKEVHCEDKTKKGNSEKKRTKYHMNCLNNDCTAFWVKNYCINCSTPLFKHYTNNFEELVEDDLWLVSCPKCGNRLD